MARPGASWRAWLATGSVTPVLAALVVLDLADASLRGWFDEHALTTSAITGVLVLLVTVLVVDRVVSLRQLRDRAQVTAAQAAIVARQAQQTCGAVTAALEDATQREPASEELRTYMTMLLVSAPILIEAHSARAFLEQAQRLAALLSYTLRAGAKRGDSSDLGARLAVAADRLHDTAQPLLSTLNLDQLAAVGGDPSAADDPGDPRDPGDPGDPRDPGDTRDPGHPRGTGD